MKKGLSKEAKIGLVTIVGLFLLYFGINFLKGVDIFKPANHYYVRFKNVSELQKSSPVYVDGFKVGLVNDIVYDYASNDGILVIIALDKSMRIEKGTYVKMSSALTTGASLHLVLNKHVDSFYSPGDTIEGRTSVGVMDRFSDNLMPQIEVMMPKLDSILTGLQALVNNPALMHSLNNLESTTGNLSKASAGLDQLMRKDIPVIMANLKAVTSDFTEVSAELKKIDFDGTMRTVDTALKNIDKMTQQINSNDNSLGLLLNDRQLYDNLTTTSANASVLLQDLKQNPKRYVHFSIW